MRPLIVANWKMHTTLAEAMILANGVKEGAAELNGIDIVLCPPFPWLVPLAELIHSQRISSLHLGAQNIFWSVAGAYTGEVSAAMLKGLVTYVIIGHSERRRVFQETDAEIVKKVQLALEYDLIPIVCIGEQRRPSRAVLDEPAELTVSQLQQPLNELKALLRGLSAKERGQLVIAYEPIWAISTTPGAQAATGLYANEVATRFRELLPHGASVLYGGSVDANNASEFLHQPNLHGALVGGSSLKIQTFLAICRLAMGSSQ